jgi:alginate O-acetyltransferase complex protein AlgI
MLFNSLEFIVFFPVVFIIYWLLKNRLTFQNLFLVVASYVFYGWWDYRFLLLIFVTTLLDYFIALRVDASEQPATRKFWVGLSITMNLGVLMFFKYFNFFIDSWIEAFSYIG